MAVDKVKPLKIENLSSGSQDDNGYPTECDPSQDYLAAKGLAINGLDTHLIDSLDNEIAILDPVNGRIKFSQLSKTGHSHVETDISDLTHNATKIQGVNVDTTTPINNQVLAYNSTQEKYIPISISSGEPHELDSHTDVPTKPTSGIYYIKNTDGTLSWITGTNAELIKGKSVDIPSFPSSKAFLTYDNLTQQFILENLSQTIPSPTPPSSPETGTIWINTTTSTPYVYSVGGEWLSLFTIDKLLFVSGNIDGAYLTVNGMLGLNYLYFKENAKLIGIECYASSGYNMKAFEVYNDTTLIHNFAFDNNYQYINNNLDININSGGKIKVFVSDVGSNIRDVNCYFYFRWRY